MTCARVVALLDAAPFADLAPEQMNAARQHSETCASCGKVMAQIAALTSGLRDLPMPAPPPSFAAAVSARIARTEDLQERAPVAQAAVPGRVRAIGAVAAGLLLIAIACRGLVTAARPIDLLMGRVGSIVLNGATSAHPLAVAILMAGLFLCVYGLSTPFAPRVPRSGAS
jgi:hypothetical protein